MEYSNHTIRSEQKTDSKSKSGYNYFLHTLRILTLWRLVSSWWIGWVVLGGFVDVFGCSLDVRLQRDWWFFGERKVRLSLALNFTHISHKKRYRQLRQLHSSTFINFSISEWSISMVTPIYEKEEKKDCKNGESAYSTLSIRSCLSFFLSS